MKAKKGFVIASTVFIGINLLLFVGLWVFIVFWNKDISAFFIELSQNLNQENDFEYWLYNAVKDNMAVIMMILAILIFLFIALKIMFFTLFIKYSKYSIKDFYTRKGKYLAMSITQILGIGSIFAMLCGITAIVIQKAIVTPDNLNQVLSNTWGQEEVVPGQNKTNNNNAPVVRVGPNARFVENISNLRDSVRTLFEANLISKGQKVSLTKKIDKLSKDRAKKRSSSQDAK